MCSPRTRSCARICVGIGIRSRGRFCFRTVPMRHASGPNLVRIFVFRLDRCRLGRKAQGSKADPANGKPETRPALHGRQISDKDSTRASDGYKSAPRWINSISYPSGASMKAMTLPPEVLCGPSESGQPFAAVSRANFSKSSTSKAR